MVYEDNEIPYFFNLVDLYRHQAKYNNGYAYNMMFVGPGWLNKGGRWEAPYRLLKKSYTDGLDYYAKLKKEGKLVDMAFRKYIHLEEALDGGKILILLLVASSVLYASLSTDSTPLNENPSLYVSPLARNGMILLLVFFLGYVYTPIFPLAKKGNMAGDNKVVVRRSFVIGLDEVQNAITGQKGAAEIKVTALLIKTMVAFGFFHQPREKKVRLLYHPHRGQ